MPQMYRLGVLSSFFKKIEIHPLGLSQFVKEKTRPNKQRAVLIWQVRVVRLHYNLQYQGQARG